MLELRCLWVMLKKLTFCVRGRIVNGVPYLDRLCQLGHAVDKGLPDDLSREVAPQREGEDHPLQLGQLLQQTFCLLSSMTQGEHPGLLPHLVDVRRMHRLKCEHIDAKGSQLFAMGRGGQKQTVPRNGQIREHVLLRCPLRGGVEVSFDGRDPESPQLRTAFEYLADSWGPGSRT